jgi:hypothetical protein
MEVMHLAELIGFRVMGVNSQNLGDKVTILTNNDAFSHKQFLPPG